MLLAWFHARAELWYYDRSYDFENAGTVGVCKVQEGVSCISR